MHSDTRRAIGGALTDRPNGLTRTELQALTGLSAATITNAIRTYRMKRVGTVRPYRYRLAPHGLTSPTEPATDTDILTMPRRREPDWIARWNTGRERIGAGLAGIEIAPDSDPRALADTLRNVARDLASLAAALTDEADNPGWYEALGGTIDGD